MTSRISLPEGYVTPACREQLQAMGFSLNSSAAPPWLTFVDLSDCRVTEVAARLRPLRKRNLIALLKPEQTELASAAMGCGAQ
ncbi:MAG: sigma-54-dependent Fis family transcriptional regulator, partial [Shewanella sp.]